MWDEKVSESNSGDAVKTPLLANVKGQPIDYDNRSKFPEPGRAIICPVFVSSSCTSQYISNSRDSHLLNCGGTSNGCVLFVLQAEYYTQLFSVLKSSERRVYAKFFLNISIRIVQAHPS